MSDGIVPVSVRTGLWRLVPAVAATLAVTTSWLRPAPGADGWPAVPGAVFALRNADITQPVVAFDAKGRQLLAFNADARGSGLFGRFHDLVCNGGSFHARDAGAWIGRQVAASGAFTIEATLLPAAAKPEADGIVLAFADDDGEDVALVQGKDGLALRLAGRRIPLFPVESGTAAHVLVACGGGRWAAYRDGRPAGDGPLPEGGGQWGERQLVFGAGWSGAEPWRGRLEAIAVFPKSLSAEDAAAEATAAAALRAGRKPARPIRFRGTLARQAETTDPAAMRPYTRSLTAAEYKVDKVLDGEWAEPTIVVLHWMVMDGKRLPLADRTPGATVELVVEPLEDHPQLESSRRDDLTDGDLAAEVFYCESEPGT